jgi:ligand-binding sensor domain-containing protein
MKYKLFSYIIAVLSMLSLKAQKYTDVHFDNFSTEYVKIQRGLSQNSILSMIEDRNGFIWIGTWDGLNRFDGYDFVIYKPETETGESGISNTTVNALLQDSQGMIWAGTDDGLNMFDPEKMVFTHYLQQADYDFSGGENRILSLAEGNAEELWVGTANGLYVFRKKSMLFRFLSFPENKLLKRPLSIFKLCRSEKSGKMWVGTNIGLFRFDLNTYKYWDVSSAFFGKLPKTAITALFEDSNGNLWIGTQNGLYKYNQHHEQPVFERIQNFQPGAEHVLSFMEDMEGNVWVGTMGGGISIYEPETGTFHSFGNEDQLYGGLTNNYIYSLLQTKNGSIWIGTWRGLNKFTPDQFRFTHIPFGQSSSFLNSNMVWSFMEMTPDLIWVGTENGINIFSRQQNQITYQTTSSEYGIRLPSNKIRSMFRDSRDVYWVGTFDAGLVAYHPQSGKSVRYSADADNAALQLAGNGVWSIAEDKTDNSLWFATNGGVTRIFENGSQKHYFHLPGDSGTISSDEIYWVICDSKNNVWFSSFSGVDLFDRKTETFKKFGYDFPPESRLKTNRILSLFEDSRGKIWFATMGEGVSIFDPMTLNMTFITVKDGLADNTVYNIVEDRSGNIWMTTNQGISKINAENLSVWNFDIRDGVQGHEFNLGASMSLSTGEIMFGGMNGFNIFNPLSFQENTYIPQIYITKFSILNKKIRDFLKNNSKIELRWWENYFSFEFAALDYANPKKINYAYMLDGFDPVWNYVPSDRRYADYTNIPPGKYTFKVKGTNSDGLWMSEELSVHITIHAPFWKTLWFKFLSAIILTFIIWYVVNSQIRKVKRKQEIERKMFDFEKNVFELEQKVLHLQMNPHFLFNALNSVQSFIMKNESESAMNYLSKFSNLMRLILHTSKSPNISISDEVNLLQYYLDIEGLRFDFRFKYTITVDPLIDEEFTAIPAHMIQPLVENSIKHGLLHKKGAGNIQISFMQFEDHIRIIVVDDGIGRQKATEIQQKKRLVQSNQGIAITQERLSILNRQFNTKVYGLDYEDVLNEDGSVGGTRAVLNVPFTDV